MSESKPVRFGSTFAERKAAREQDGQAEKRVRSDDEATEDKAVTSSESKARRPAKKKS